MNRDRPLDVPEGVTMSNITPRPAERETQPGAGRALRGALAFVLCILGAGLLLWEIWGGTTNFGVGMGIAAIGVVVLLAGILMAAAIGRAPHELRDPRRSRALHREVEREAIRHMVGRTGGVTVLVVIEDAPGPRLIRRLGELQARERQPEFTVLVPARPDGEGGTWTEEQATADALARGRALRDALISMGLRVGGVLVGDKSAAVAVQDELRARSYTRILIHSANQGGLPSRLGLDTVQRVRSSYPGPVEHIVEEAEFSGSQVGTSSSGS
jgi:hypothetical protein